MVKYWWPFVYEHTDTCDHHLQDDWIDTDTKVNT